MAWGNRGTRFLLHFWFSVLPWQKALSQEIGNTLSYTSDSIFTMECFVAWTIYLGIYPRISSGDQREEYRRLYYYRLYSGILGSRIIRRREFCSYPMSFLVYPKFAYYVCPITNSLLSY